MNDDRLAKPANRSRRVITLLRSLALTVPLLTLSSCSGIQSALDPAGREAHAVATLFWAMVAGGGVIWAAVMGALIYAARLKKKPFSERQAGGIILFGGVAFPVVVLAGLIAYAVWLMPAMRPWFPGEGEGLRRIEITAEQYWWRVRYLDSKGNVLRESANEVYMPVDERVLFLLKAKDVIHSFWIPSLGGKMDAIPGRVNSLQLEATSTGSYRGVCAEFCGTAHALMAFTVEVMEGDAFEAWLQKGPQPVMTNAALNDGFAAFLRNGCGACHAVDGTEARGTIGPNLSAFGKRPTIAAGTLPNTTKHLIRFIKNPDLIKPGVNMPSYGMLPQTEIEAIALYLKALE